MNATQKVSVNTRNSEVYTTVAMKGLALGSQHKLKLKLLSEINRLSDKSLSAEQFLRSALTLIQEYYNANACFAVIKIPDDSNIIFKAETSTVNPMLLGVELDQNIALHLLAIPPQHSILYTPQTEWCTALQITDKPQKRFFETISNFGEAISYLLKVDSFASVPLWLDEQYIGRLYLTNCNQNFDEADMFFLQQLGNQIKPQINHIRLRNKIAINATAAATLAMRHKISIDLHDSTIQPYIGLKLGLEALRRKIPDGSTIAAEMDELVIMAGESITELRQYIVELKSQITSQLKPQLGTSLVASILEVAKKYQLRHGIEVAVNIDTKLKVSEHLSIEIYQLVCEGLSNIHRHTQAMQAKINLFCKNDQLVLEVINYDESAKDFIHFRPRSMTERVTYLGGTINVKHSTSDQTTVGNTLSDKVLNGKTLSGKTLAGITTVTAEIPLTTNRKTL